MQVVDTNYFGRPAPPRHGNYRHFVTSMFVQVEPGIEKARNFIKAGDDINAWTQFIFALGASVSIIQEINKRNSSEGGTYKGKFEGYKRKLEKTLENNVPVMLSLEAKVAIILNNVFSRYELTNLTQSGPEGDKVREQINFVLDKLIAPAKSTICEGGRERTLAHSKTMLLGLALLHEELNSTGNASFLRSKAVKLAERSGWAKTAFGINNVFGKVEQIEFPTKRYIQVLDELRLDSNSFSRFNGKSLDDWGFELIAKLSNGSFQAGNAPKATDIYFDEFEEIADTVKKIHEEGLKQPTSLAPSNGVSSPHRSKKRRSFTSTSQDTGTSDSQFTQKHITPPLKPDQIINAQKALTDYFRNIALAKIQPANEGDEFLEVFTKLVGITGDRTPDFLYSLGIRGVDLLNVALYCHKIQSEGKVPHLERVLKNFTPSPTIQERDRVLEGLESLNKLCQEGSTEDVSKRLFYTDATKGPYSELDKTVKDLFIKNHLSPNLSIDAFIEQFHCSPELRELTGKFELKLRLEKIGVSNENYEIINACRRVKRLISLDLDNFASFEVRLRKELNGKIEHIPDDLKLAVDALITGGFITVKKAIPVVV